MHNQLQGVSSNKVLPHQVTERQPEKKKWDVFITMYKPKSKLYTNQTGKFPHRSSRGNKYLMILHKIDGKSTFIERMKTNMEGEMILA